MMMQGLKTIHKWWTTWRTMPVSSWVKAAALYKSGKFEEAQLYYRKGLASHKKHPARFCARIDLAYCLFRCQKLQEAEENLCYVLQQVPQSREAGVRLAQLYFWTGNHVKAASIYRDLVKYNPTDADLVGRFVIAVMEAPHPDHLLRDAVQALFKLESKQMGHPRIETARAILALHKGDYEKGRAVLAAITANAGGPLEAYLWFSRLLIEEGKVLEARLHLNHALAISSSHPCVLAMLAETYLAAGATYSPDFAAQLASQACQYSNWLHPGHMHVLAKAYHHTGDRMAALLAASKAKEVGVQRLGVFQESDTLDRLIESLSDSTLV